MPKAMALTSAAALLRQNRAVNQDYWHYWDSDVLSAAITTLPGGPLFSNVAGKNPYQSNLRQTPLPRPQIFDVYSMSFYIDSDAAAAGVATDSILTAVISILEDSRFDFLVGSKNMFEGDLPHVPAGGGGFFIGENDNQAAATVDGVLTNGVPSPAFQIVFPWKITINHGENFQVAVTWGHAIDTGGLNGGAGRLFCFLEGLLDRGVTS